MRVSTWTKSTQSGALGAPMVIAIIQCGTRTRTVIRKRSARVAEPRLAGRRRTRVRHIASQALGDSSRQDGTDQASRPDQSLGMRRWPLLVPSLHPADRD